MVVSVFTYHLLERARFLGRHGPMSDGRTMYDQGIGVGGNHCTCGTLLVQSTIVPPAWHGPHLKGYFWCSKCERHTPRIMATDEAQGDLSVELVEAGLARQRKALSHYEGTT